MVAAVRALLCLTLCLSACQVKGSHIPVEMNKTIQKLLQHYHIPVKERFNGVSVFKNPLQGKTETQMLMLGAILEKYEEIIGYMLEQLPTPSPQTANSTNSGPSDGAAAPAPAALSAAGGSGPNEIRKMLNGILKNIRLLTQQRYREQGELLQKLKDLQDIKMSDPVVQSKALSELLPLYQAAGSLSDRKRRRRQTRAKNRPRF